MRRIARAVVGRAKAKELVKDDIWFEVANVTDAVSQDAEVGAEVLPFRTLTPEDKDFAPYKSCVPLSSLKAAAGTWSDEQSGLVGVADQAEEWVVLESGTLEPGMFVAQVVGKSMEPLVPDGSYCLFRSVPAGSRQGRRLLVWHSGVTDQETGGQYTLKVYSSEKIAEEGGDWQHLRITLKPLNPEFEPVVLEPESEGEVIAIAELVEVLG